MFTRDQSQMDPTLSWNGPFHTVPFRLSMSVHTGPVCYGSALNQSKKSSCTVHSIVSYQLHLVSRDESNVLRESIMRKFWNNYRQIIRSEM